MSFQVCFLSLPFFPHLSSSFCSHHSSSSSQHLSTFLILPLLSFSFTCHLPPSLSSLLLFFSSSIFYPISYFFFYLPMPPHFWKLQWHPNSLTRIDINRNSGLRCPIFTSVMCLYCFQFCQFYFFEMKTIAKFHNHIF